MKRFQTICYMTLFSLFIAYPIGLAQDDNTAKVFVREVLGVGKSNTQFKMQQGVGLAGQGSWIKTGGKYRDPLARLPNGQLKFINPSDMDIRVVLPPNTQPQEAIRIYNNVRSQLVSRARVVYGDKADDVLRTINLYLPDDVMAGVSSEAEAITLMRKYGVQTPNLGGAAPEGLFTPGRVEFTRGYERAGKVFYTKGGRMYQAYADIISDVLPGADDVVLHTMRGATSNAVAFAKKAMTALAAESGDDIIKNMTRAESGLRKAYTFAKQAYKPSPLWREVRGAARRNPLFYLEPGMSQKIGRLTKQAALEARLLGRLEASSLAEKELILRWLKDMRAGTTTWQRIWSVFKRVPFDRVGQVLSVLFLWYEGYVVSGMLGEGKIEEGLRETGVFTAFTAVGLGTGMAVMAANLIIDQAKEFGYDLVASTQDCEDLLDGIFSVKGREVNTLDSAGKSLNIEDLVLLYQTESEVRNLIAQRVHNAAQRGLGEATGEADRVLEERLNSRCFPEIVKKWGARRNQLDGELASIYSTLAQTPISLEINPDPTVFGSRNERHMLRAAVDFPMVDSNGMESEARYILDRLAGPRKYSFALDVNWMLDDTPLENWGRETEIRIRKPGPHTITAQVSLWIRSGVNYMRLYPKIEREISLEINAVFPEETPKQGRDIEKEEPPEKIKVKREGSDAAVKIPPKTKRTPESPPSSADSALKGHASSDRIAKVAFKVTAPGNWEGIGPWDDVGRAGIYFTRKKIEKKYKDKVGGYLSIYGTFDLKWESSDTPENVERYGKELPAEAKRWSKKTFEKISFNGFKGYALVEKPHSNDYNNAFNIAMTDGKTVIEGKAYYKNVVISFSGYIAGTSQGRYNKPPIDAHVMPGLAELKGILQSVTLVEKSERITTPEKVVKIIEVQIKADKKDPQLNDAVELKAVVSGVKSSEVTYAWTGDHAGKGANVTFVASKPGKYTLSVTVNGPDGITASDSIDFDIKAPEVIIKRTDGKSKIAVGDTISFIAEIKDGKDKAYIYRWEPYPDLDFKPSEGTKPTTDLLLSKPGKHKAWVEILQKEGENTLKTVAKSDDLEFSVDLPKAEIEFSKKTPYVGEEVTATAKLIPDPGDELADVRWMPLPSNGKLLKESKDSRKITFTAKDTKPINVEYLALVRHHGDDLGKGKASLTAKLYDVKITTKKFGPPVKTWDPAKKGLVTVGANTYLTGQEFRLIAALEGSPKPRTVNWKWKMNDGVTISNPNSQTPTVSRSRAGSINAKVTATDQNKIILGTGSINLSVTDPVSAPPDKDKKQTEKLLKQARTQWSNGELDKAVSILETAQKTAPNDAEIKKRLNEYREKKTRIQAKMKEAREKEHLGKMDDAVAAASAALKENPANQKVIKYIDTVKWVKAKTDKDLEKVSQLIDACEFKQAQDALIPINNAFPYYPPAQEMKRRLGTEWQEWIAEVNAALGEVRMASARRDFKEALELIAKTRSTLKLLPSQLKTLADAEAYCRKMEAKKEKARRLFRLGKAKLEVFDYQGALDDITEGFNMTGNLWNTNTDTTTTVQAQKVLAEAVKKKKELDVLFKGILGALEYDPYPGRIKDFERALQQCADAKTLQPSHPNISTYENELQEKLRQARSYQGGTGNAGGGTQGSPSASWRLTPDGYPLISGAWNEESGSVAHSVRIEQSGNRFTAYCTYKMGSRENSWKQTGTLDRSGKTVSELQHLNIPESSLGYRQHREMQLSPDGNTLKGHATFTGGGHPLTWTRVGAKDSQKDPISRILGVWEHTIHTHKGCDKIESFCKRYDIPVTFSRGSNGGLEARSDRLLMKGSLVGQDFRFKMYWTPTGAYHGTGHFAFSQDFTSFNGSFEDINGHRGTWNSSGSSTTGSGNRKSDAGGSESRAGSDRGKNIDGLWRFHTDNYVAELRFQGPNSQLQGTIKFQGGGVEKLTEISYDGKTLRFTRPNPRAFLTQIYHGILDYTPEGKRRMIGNYNFINSGGNYGWYAIKQEKRSAQSQQKTSRPKQTATQATAKPTQTKRTTTQSGTTQPKTPSSDRIKSPAGAADTASSLAGKQLERSSPNGCMGGRRHQRIYLLFSRPSQ